ncbi:MAG: MBL fold metallo-hydrolase [Propionibacteriaceae bacterium]|nr:MBL fold metallo-hydrolase [Propionibacteriaceae bacterium]
MGIATTLTFLGGAGTVTGSKYLLTVGERRILIDAGLFQGEKELRELNWAEFGIPPAAVSDVLLTHAHMDHVGYLPRLVAGGFSGPVWATAPSIRLSEIVLRDSAFLNERDAEHAAQRGYSKHRPPLPLYTTEDVEATLPLFRAVGYHHPLDLGDGIVARYYPAGHILGSASIHVTTPATDVVFSGDVGRRTHPVLRPREVPPGATTVLIESTYGDREHPEPDTAHEPFADLIRRTVRRGGSVLVPAFAVDRTEVLLKTLSEMQDDGRIPEVPIFVNSPMALAALAVYRDPEFAGELRPDLDPAHFIHLPQLREVRSTEESIRLNDPKHPCIIIASSGMATGGRVLHHLEHMLPDHKHSVVLVGYQGEGTRGRSLVNGATQLKMHGRYVPVRAEVLQDDEFSVHGDRSDLLDWLADLTPRPQTVFTVHGTPEVGRAFGAHITERTGVMAIVPTLGESVRLD